MVSYVAQGDSVPQQCMELPLIGYSPSFLEVTKSNSEVRDVYDAPNLGAVASRL